MPTIVYQLSELPRGPDGAPVGVYRVRLGERNDILASCQFRGGIAEGVTGRQLQQILSGFGRVDEAVRLDEEPQPVVSEASLSRARRVVATMDDDAVVGTWQRFMEARAKKHTDALEVPLDSASTGPFRDRLPFVFAWLADHVDGAGLPDDKQIEAMELEAKARAADDEPVDEDGVDDLDAMKRPALIKLAHELGVKEPIRMKVEELRAAVRLARAPDEPVDDEPVDEDGVDDEKADPAGDTVPPPPPPSPTEG